jgi:parallel beta-helix repeat protein
MEDAMWNMVLSRSAILVCLIVIPTVLGGEGAIPVWQPTTISQPGEYVVTRNIRSTPGQTVIWIQSSDVEVNLNGFTVENTGTTGYVIRIANGLDNVVIRDGCIRGGATGVYMEGGDTRVSVLDNRIKADSYGIGANGCDRCRVSGNIIEARNFDGVQIPGDELSVTGNTISPSGRYGIYMPSGESAHIADNLITDCEKGIWLISLDGSRIAENVIRGCSGDGLQLSEARGNQVLDNTVSGCTGNGLWIDGSAGTPAAFNQVEENLLSENGQGLVLGSWSQNNVYRANTARGNAVADFMDTGTGNTSHGDNYMPFLM